MTPRLSEADVRRIAALARLELTAEEIETFAQQLADILTYAEDVRQVDTTGVAPTSHPLGGGPVWRPDTPVPSLDRDLILDRAPDSSKPAGLFKVPKVL
jgi:aspartyl-tRNA(Asn)/glutamyl-tRNA(Gln) amidotransferase subunit C